MAKEIQKIVKKLLSSGMSEKDLAKQVGCSQPHIHRMKQGDTDPSYSIGKALEKLHDEQFKRPN